MAASIAPVGGRSSAVWYAMTRRLELRRPRAVDRPVVEAGCGQRPLDRGDAERLLLALVGELLTERSLGRRIDDAGLGSPAER